MANDVMLYDPYGRAIRSIELEYEERLARIEKRDRSLVAFISPWEAQRGITPPVTFYIRDFLAVTGSEGGVVNLWVAASVRAIYDMAKQIPIALYEKKSRAELGEKLKEEHAILTLLDDVNPRMTYAELVEAYVTYLALGGNCFFGLEHPEEPDNPQALPTEIWPLRPDYMRIIPSLNPETFGEVLQYEIWTGSHSQHIVYRPTEIIHIKEFAPLNSYWGLSRLAAARGTLLRAHWMNESNSNFFRQGMRADGILYSEQEITPDTWDRINRRWMEANTGVRKHHRPMVLDHGLKWQQLTIAPKDAEWLAGLQVTKQEIVGGVFGLPPLAVGDYSDASVLANAAVQDKKAWRVAVEYIQRLCGALNEFLLPRYPDSAGVILAPDVSGIEAFQEDEKLKAEVLRTRAETYSKLVSYGVPLGAAFEIAFPDQDAQIMARYKDVVLAPTSVTLLDDIINPPEPPPGFGFGGGGDRGAQGDQDQPPVEGQKRAVKKKPSTAKRKKERSR